MYTYKIKQGDIAKFPNGVEVNYDAVTESLVILARPVGSNVPLITQVPGAHGDSYFLLRFEP